MIYIVIIYDVIKKFINSNKYQSFFEDRSPSISRPIYLLYFLFSIMIRLLFPINYLLEVHTNIFLPSFYRIHININPKFIFIDIIDLTYKLIIFLGVLITLARIDLFEVAFIIILIFIFHLKF